MTAHVLQFVELSDRDRNAAKTFDKLGKGDQVEVRVRRKSGQDQVVRLPPKAAALLETALGHLLQGERVAVLAKDQELSPNDAADILGISRPSSSIAGRDDQPSCSMLTRQITGGLGHIRQCRRGYDQGARDGRQHFGRFAWRELFRD